VLNNKADLVGFFVKLGSLLCKNGTEL